MKDKKTKKFISLLVSFLMIFTTIPFSMFVSAADYPVMDAYNAASSGDYHKYYNKVVSVTFLDKIDYDDINASDTIESWDVSLNDDGSVMAWMKLNDSETQLAGVDRYDVYIGGEGGVGANPSSTHIFYLFTALKEVNGIENFKTDNVTDMSFMFGGCYSLIKLDLSSFNTSSVTKMASLFRDCKVLEELNVENWDTSNVTTMAYMFSNCHALTELDISSFDTRKVTDMDHMFYLCNNLVTIYTGDNWNVDAVTNSNAMFNCCYVIEGKTQYNYNATNDKTFATTEYYLTDISEKPQPVVAKYTVKYVLEGDIPEKFQSEIITSFEADEGTVIYVEDVLSEDGYVFSGWNSEDADITGGSFVLESDVTITGTWDKLYNVYYEYRGEVPSDAPTLNTYSFKAGETVTVDGEPTAEGYTFVGWSTEDVVVTDGGFTMPGKDVLFYGYFKKPVSGVVVNTGNTTLNVDDEITLEVTVNPEDATIKDLTYESGDETVVKVDENGKITAVGEGTTTVTVSSKDDPTKKDTITVTVKIPVTDVIVDKKDVTLNVGESEKVIVTVSPDGATNKDIEYESLDETVAKVDNEGNITAVGKGTTTVVVTSKDDPSKKETISVTVIKPVESVVIETEDTTVNIGENVYLDVIINPDDASTKELVYESSDETVATVDENGNVTAVGEGEAVITVSSKSDPTKKDTITVTVEKPVVPVEKVVINTEDTTLEIDEEIKLDVTVTPDGATDSSVTYESSDETVVKVDENGNVTAVGEGEAVITVSSKSDSTKKDTITITVKSKETTTQPEETTTEPEETTTESEETTTQPEETTTQPEVTTTKPEEPTKPEKPNSYTITINGENEMEIGENQTLTATIKETLAPGVNGAIRWFTYNSDIIELDPVTGEVKALKSGNATVKATLVSTGDNVTFEITVREPDYEIVAPDSFVVGVDEKINLGVSVTPEIGNPKITYTSADKSVAIVDEKGNVTGVGAGITTVTVDLGNGTIKVIPVIVTAEPTIKPLHHICFGKTDGIGWYEVSVNDGDFFPQGPNSTLEVEEGSVIVVRLQDMWIDDDFTFYVNGGKVEEIAPNTIVLTVRGYMLISALSMDVEVPDAKESLNLFERIIKAIKDFFENRFSIFK